MLALVGAVALGTAFGYAAQRGAFCLSSGFSGVLEGDWTKVKALFLAVALQLVLLPAVFGLSWAKPAALPLQPACAVVGGVLFGMSMRWAGGCAAGVWYKLGAGDMGALLAVLGMALGATAAGSGPLHILTASLQDAVLVPIAWKPAPSLSIGAGILLLAILARTTSGRAGAWSWPWTGLCVGLVALLAWPVSAAAGRDFGLAVVPGTAGLVAGLSGRPFPAWDVLLVLGLVAGGWLAARRAGPVALRAPGPSALIARFAGGLGLGVGASIAAGCTVGQGLTGLALLAPSSVLVMAAIFAGSALSAAAARRPGAAAREILAPARRAR